MTPLVQMVWTRKGSTDPLKFPFAVTGRPFGSFPVGVWGPPQDDDNRPMPKGDVIEALCELDLSATADIGEGGPQIPYYQVEINDRRPLPFKRRSPVENAIRNAGTRLTALVAAPADIDAAFATAGRFLNTPRARLRWPRSAESARRRRWSAPSAKVWTPSRAPSSRRSAPRR